MIEGQVQFLPQVNFQFGGNSDKKTLRNSTNNNKKMKLVNTYSLGLLTETIIR